MRVTMAVVMCGLALVACSGNPLDSVLPPKGSCNVPASHTCTDYTGTAWSVPSSGSRACNAVGNGATYSSSGCSSTVRVGSCIVSAGSSSEIVTRFYSPATTAVAQGLCAMQSGTTFVAN